MASSNERKLPSLGKRLLGGLLLFSLLLAFLIAGSYAFAALIFILGTIALEEYARLFAHRGFHTSTVLMALWLGGFMAKQLFAGPLENWPILASLMIVSVTWMIYRFNRGDETAAIEFALTLSGGFLVGWSLSHVVSLRNMEDGLFYCLLLIFATSGADTGAYFAGSLFGKHRFFPRISPKKSLEGYLGGILFGPLLTGVMAMLFNHLGAGPDFTFWHGSAIGLIIAPFAPIGDLVISIFKRFAGVKDTGTLIPGHGGILDRVDSYLVSILILYYSLPLLAS